MTTTRPDLTAILEAHYARTWQATDAERNGCCLVSKERLARSFRAEECTLANLLLLEAMPEGRATNIPALAPRAPLNWGLVRVLINHRYRTEGQYAVDVAQFYESQLHRVSIAELHERTRQQLALAAAERDEDACDDEIDYATEHDERTYRDAVDTARRIGWEVR